MITCLDCGRRVRALEQHVRMKHGRSIAEYLAGHQLPADTEIVAPEVREAAAAGRRRQGPEVTAARSAAGRRTVSAAHQAKRDQMEARARAAGFGSMAEAIEATGDLTLAAAAARIGVGQTTVMRWRRLA